MDMFVCTCFMPLKKVRFDSKAKAILRSRYITRCYAVFLERDVMLYRVIFMYYLILIPTEITTTMIPLEETINK